jgi:class 3 adenylate cyclase
LAEHFHEVTILFADLVGFTAWSSTREPCQVFELLEIIFTQFDEIANRRGVYSVETVGDCYVAACGLPHARKNHAVVMARFANDCLRSMHLLAKKLEVTLGPDTADLGIRIGIHR